MRTDRKELFRVRFEQHYPRLCSIAYGYVSDYDESEDIVQELFIYIWDKGKDCLPEQELTAYLTTAVRTAASLSCVGKKRTPYRSRTIRWPIITWPTKQLTAVKTDAHPKKCWKKLSRPCRPSVRTFS